jgi:glycine/D-amino acid oxidase-like deaminating enzyme
MSPAARKIPHYDAIVVGGGVAGGAAALFLANRGRKVLLLERDRVGARASGVNFGGVRQQGRDLREIPLSHLARRIWAELPRHVGIDGERQFTGHLRLARSAADMAVLEQYRKDAGALGLELELIGRNALRERYPWIGPEVAGGSLAASDGQANPRVVGPAFALAARAAGAEIREGAEVVGATREGSVYCIQSADGREARADTLVNAAGAWAGDLAALLGDPIPLEPRIPQVLVTEPAKFRVSPVLGMVGGGLYLRQVQRGNLIFGTVDRLAAGDYRLTRPTPEMTQLSAKAALAIVPEIARLAVIRSWTGVDGYMADGVPVVGPSARLSGLFHAFGFCGHGFQLGPAAGWVVAELVAGERPSADISGLDATRLL